MPVYEPVGRAVTKQSKVKHVVNPGDCIELSDVEAHGLVKLDCKNFAMAGKKPMPSEVKPQVELKEEVSAVMAEVANESAPKKRRGRPKKIDGEDAAVEG